MIRVRISRALAAGGILVLVAGTGRAASPDAPTSRTTVRSGNHPGFGRVVIDTNGKTVYHLGQDGDHAVVHFAADVVLGNPPSPPRNVIAITTDGPTADLTLAHGAKVHPALLDGRVVIDILDAPNNAAPPAKIHRSDTLPKARPHAPLAMASSPELGGRSVAGPAFPPTPTAVEIVPVEVGPLPPPVQSLPDPGTIEVIEQTTPGRDVMPERDGPVGLMARRIKLPKEMDGSGFLVPFDSTTGAAAFRSGDSTYIVVDERRPVDMGALRSDPVFHTASVQLLSNGTLIRVPLSPALSLALTQLPQGWRIAALTTAPKQQPIVVSSTNGRLDLTAEQPGDVVSLADPATGATLLVGTQHRPGQGLATRRRGTDFILRPTIQGVVIEPLSDSIVLRQVPAGFSLAGGPAGLALSPPTRLTDALIDAAHLTGRFNFSTMPPEALLHLANKQIADAAAAPPLARGIKNHIAAQSFLALGLAAEAGGLLHMAADQDPKEATSAETGALTAIAALLAGRPEDADALTDPRLNGTDEISLWRAVRQAMQDDGSPGAAAVFAATAPLVFQYPESIRDHILPLIVETMIKGGEVAAAARLLDERNNDPKLAYARALMQQAGGDTDRALNMLDALANGHDQFDRARAAVGAVELRLTVRKLDKTQAADALDKLSYAWRGDRRELALRERIAELRGQTGAWRVALAALRQAETDFPEQAPAIHQRLKDMFVGMIRDQGEHQASPIEFVSMVEENADLALDAADDDAVQQSLADRLLALDLPDRAKPVLEKLMRSAKSDTAKARFGAGLATLESRDANDAGARTVLDASEGRDLPPDLLEQRTILRAEVSARLGDPVAGAAMLAPFRTARATEARAQILENASDWPGAEQAWSDCVALTLPESGMLDESRTRMMLRLATATARASDDAGLADLRVKYGNRVGAGPLGDMFRLLTAEPVRTTADIGRSQKEMSLVASLPSDLKALQANATTR
jgi:tetratricopeptide (TPR) repeat protein